MRKMRRHSWQWQFVSKEYPGYAIHKCGNCGIGRISLKRPGMQPKVRYFKNKSYFAGRPQCIR